MLLPPRKEGRRRAQPSKWFIRAGKCNYHSKIVFSGCYIGQPGQKFRKSKILLTYSEKSG